MVEIIELSIKFLDNICYNLTNTKWKKLNNFLKRIESAKLENIVPDIYREVIELNSRLL